MSRPANPTITAPTYPVRTFSTDANYPAGPNPWNLQPTKVEPPGPDGGFVPDQDAAPGYFNQLFYDAFTEIAAAKALQNTNAAEVQADFANVLNYAGQIPALNWLRQNTALGTLEAAHYVEATRRLFVFGAANNVRSTNDHGLSWTNWAPIGGAAGENMIAGASNALGELCLSTDTRYVFNQNVGTGVFSRVDVVGAAHTNRCNVVYDPIHARWCHVTASAGGVMLCKTSTDRVTWAAATTVGAGTAFQVNQALAVKPSTGRIVLISPNTISARVVTSDDGGVNWTDRPNIVHTISARDRVGLTYNAFDDSWTCVIGSTTAFNTEVWRSTDDGATWTKVATLSTVGLGRAACLGKLLVAAGKTSGLVNETAYSIDDGATWRFSGVRIGSTAIGCHAAAGGIVAISGADVTLSARVGMPGEVLT